MKLAMNTIAGDTAAPEYAAVATQNKKRKNNAVPGEIANEAAVTDGQR